MSIDIKLELNAREQKRFANLFRNIELSARRVAEEIEKGDESAAAALYAVFAMTLATVREFHELVDQAIIEAREKMGICAHKGTTTLLAGVVTCDNCGKPVTSEIFGG